MNKVFKENGTLSDEGKTVLQPLKNGLVELMASNEVRNMSVAELRVLQCNLASLIGNTVSDAILAKSKE